jgi:hypothetical protein
MTSGDDPHEEGQPFLFGAAEEEESRREEEARKKAAERKAEAEE